MPFSTHGKKRLLIVLRERPDRHSQWSSDSLFPASDSHQVSGFIQAIHQHVEINKSAVRLPLLKDPLSPNCIERLPQLKPTGKTVARALIIHREDMASPHASQQGVLRRPAPDSSKLHQAPKKLFVTFPRKLVKVNPALYDGAAYFNHSASLLKVEAQRLDFFRLGVCQILRARKTVTHRTSVLLPENLEDARRVLRPPALSPGWRGSFEKRLAKAASMAKDLQLSGGKASCSGP